jgi:predicted TIM-barrel fold metal-dependent hydrolase
MTPSFDAHLHLWQHHIGGLPAGTFRGGGRDQLHMMSALMDRHGIERACAVAACNGDDLVNHEFVYLSTD